MIILGEKVKALRKNLGLTQKQLAQGICTQVTISKIENRNSVPTMEILNKLCERLEVSIPELCKTDSNSNNAFQIFKQVEYLSSQFEHQKAYHLLINRLKKEQLSKVDLKQYYYYLGMTLLSGFNNRKEALHYFNLALVTDRSSQLNFMDILITNAIGIAYFSNLEVEKGKEYFDQSLQDLENLPQFNPDHWKKLLNLYFNSAKFYSELEDYQRAIDLSQRGISILKERGLNYLLDAFLYECGYNSYKNKQKKEAEKYYFMALGVALVKENKLLLDIIRKDSLAFKLKLTAF